MPAMLLLCVALLAVLPIAGVADEPTVVRLSEPVESTDSYEVFGAPLEVSGETHSLAELVDGGDAFIGSEVHVTTRVAKVCQKKGCFFIAQDGDAVARVKFKDYAFFIPTDSADKQVTLTGVFTRKELTAEQVSHYAADEGSEEVAKPRSEYQIVASSIRIPKT